MTKQDDICSWTVLLRNGEYFIEFDGVMHGPMSKETAENINATLRAKADELGLTRIDLAHPGRA